MTVTLHFQSTGTVPGNGRPVTMKGKSLTVGRGAENDMVLPDPDKMISKHHCTLEETGGEVVVIDLSSNGTFLNYGKVPLGGTPTPLNDGDILTLGRYELLVQITARGAAELASPYPPQPVPAPSRGVAAGLDPLNALGDDDDFLNDLLGPSSDLTGPSGVKRPQPGDDGLLPPLEEADLALFPAEPSTPAHSGASRPAHSAAVHDHFAPRAATGPAIPDDWDDDMLSPAAPDPADPFALPEVPSPPEPLPDLDPPVAAPLAEEAPPVRAAPTPTEDAAARAFLKSVGAGEIDIGATDLVPTLSRLGHVLRIMVEGLREILMTRSSIKSEFRIEHTRIAAGGNNPFKFSVSPEQAIEAMVRPNVRGYLDATDAATEALRDIKAHEVAMITGMEAALKGVLARLSPQALESRLQPSGGLSGLMTNKKARYWEIYQTMYSEISDQAENDFHELFAREFARAYQDQLERLK